MGRPKREVPGGMVFHVLNRAVGRRTLFEKAEDFLAFERVVDETLRVRRMRICTDRLIPNHWHFVLWLEHDGLLGYKGKQVRDNIHGHDVRQFMRRFTEAPRCGEVHHLGGGRVSSSLDKMQEHYPGSFDRLLQLVVS